MSTPLWQPNSASINQTNMIDYIRFIESEYGVAFENYQRLHQWSVDQNEDFWASIWRFGEIIASQPWQQVLTDENKFPGARWFTEARLNFAENLLRFANDKTHCDKTAIISRLENGERQALSYSELYSEVEKLSAGLKAAGVGPGDRVAAFMPPLSPCSLPPAWVRCGRPAHRTLASTA
jgi:acetoacetyl-CoA synthetase